jgi:hypothetical protein
VAGGFGRRPRGGAGAAEEGCAPLHDLEAEGGGDEMGRIVSNC